MTPIETEHDATLILNAIPQVGPVTFKRFRDNFGNDSRRVFSVGRPSLLKVEGVGSTIANTIGDWPRYFDLEREKERMDKTQCRFIPYESENYSPLLKQIYDPPIGLYAMGSCDPGEKTLAIVGSRRSTLYGRGIAKKLAYDLAKLGFCIVSGMARGIDSAAHEGALEAGGATIAVLGCGIDIIYPPENKSLYEAIRNNGGAVMSEYPFGKRADKQTFPRRNRIVSGMAQSVIVIETDTNGGSMITARMASEQGRHVFAVPGRIDQNSSKGCHDLIRDGATLCTGAESILEEIEYLSQLEMPLGSGSTKSINQVELPDDLTPTQISIVNHLRESKGDKQELMATALQMEIPSLAADLVMLELKRLVAKQIDGSYEAC